MNQQDSQFNPTVEAQPLQHEEILEEYRRRQIVEHLTGPMISLLLHGLVVVACAILLVGRDVRPEAAFTFEIKEFKAFDPNTMEELKDLEDQPVARIVSTVERPILTPEEMVVETPGLSDVIFVMEAPPSLDLNIKSPVSIPIQLQHRTQKGRDDALREYGGPLAKHIERPVLKALHWLKNNQEADGSWSPRQYPESMTGLALLAFLAHGETPATSEEFGQTVQTAIQWLANHMLAKGNRLEGKSYCHGIATYALAEAYGLTKIPFLQPAMETGLLRIVNGQQPNGGFDYNYAKGERWDLSVTVWQIQAMKAGYIAGAKVPGLEEAMLQSIDFLNNVAYKDGKFGYSSPGSGRPSMWAAGTLALQLLGKGTSNEAKRAMESMADLQPTWKGNDFAHGATYGWYYGTQAMFHGGPNPFARWNAIFAPMLIKNQQADGHWNAPPEDSHANSAMEPFYNTTLNALSLMVYYRYLPTYKEPTQIAKTQADIFDFDDAEL